MFRMVETPPEILVFYKPEPSVGKILYWTNGTCHNTARAAALACNRILFKQHPSGIVTVPRAGHIALGLTLGATGAVKLVS